LESGIDFIIKGLAEEDKKIICFNKGKIPRSEAELEDHHKVLSACRHLITVGSSLNCLSDIGKKFPNIYQNFIYQVAKYFYDYEVDSKNAVFNIFNSFIENLISYINEVNRCHIATLNYDKLLYKNLIERDILKGYDGCLVDGIYKYSSGFRPENLIPFSYHDFGWYMHLHGSPAFNTQADGTINKCSSNEMPETFTTDDSQHNHIVLANTESKPYIIANSKLLDWYFNFFVTALAESNVLILFGYSGCDKHINFEIKKRLSNKKPPQIIIIEWNGNSNENERQIFWKKELCPDNCKNNPLKLKRMENILNYGFNRELCDGHRKE